MHFSLIVVLAVLAANVSAVPVNSIFIRAGTCDILPCVTALQPSFPACAPAVTAKGTNAPSNAACLTAAAKGPAAFPASCVPCAPQFGVTDPANKSKKVPRAPQKNAQRPAAATANNAETPAVNNAQPAAAPAPVPPPVPAKKTKKPTNAAARPAPRATCDIKACTIALEPSFPVCAPAVTKLGADNALNLACIAAAAKGTAAFPSACDGCAAQFGVTAPGAATAAGHA
ncbi:hypothetical protein FB451DRAFT_1412770 [Mycena latifolia]|nr:hypothetical protein FB451DRAFT_1412770 [Mycena latifolia]